MCSTRVILLIASKSTLGDALTSPAVGSFSTSRSTVKMQLKKASSCQMSWEFLVFCSVTGVCQTTASVLTEPSDKTAATREVNANERDRHDARGSRCRRGHVGIRRDAPPVRVLLVGHR